MRIKLRKPRKLSLDHFFFLCWKEKGWLSPERLAGGGSCCWALKRPKEAAAADGLQHFSRHELYKKRKERKKEHQSFVPLVPLYDDLAHSFSCSMVSLEGRVFFSSVFVFFSFFLSNFSTSERSARSMLLVFRNINTVRGINVALGAPVDRYYIMAKSAVKCWSHTVSQKSGALANFFLIRWIRAVWDGFVFELTLRIQITSMKLTSSLLQFLVYVGFLKYSEEQEQIYEFLQA